MTYLLDVNALLSLGFDQHEHHGRLEKWVDSLPPGDSLATCAITEIGFLRVLHQVPQYSVSIADGQRLISKLRANRKRTITFLQDHHGAADLPTWVKTGRQTTDGHLLGLAAAQGALLATLDAGIPGAFLVP
jgi:predicted nucleic acid-binding protein